MFVGSCYHYVVFHKSGAHCNEDVAAHRRNHSTHHNMCRNCLRNEMMHADARGKPVVKAACEIGVPHHAGVQALACVFKHLSASEVAQSILNVSKLQEHRVLPEADYQVLVHSFREDKVKILWMCGVLWWPVLVLCPRQFFHGHLQVPVQESGVWSLGVEVLYEPNGNLAILKSGDKNRWRFCQAFHSLKCCVLWEQSAWIKW